MKLKSSQDLKDTKKCLLVSRKLLGQVADELKSGTFDPASSVLPVLRVTRKSAINREGVDAVRVDAQYLEAAIEMPPLRAVN